MTNVQRKRYDVRPRLSDSEQVKGRNNISCESNLSADLKHIKNITLLRYLKKILKTVVKVLKRESISEDGMETAANYGDYLFKIGKVITVRTRREAG